MKRPGQQGAGPEPAGSPGPAASREARRRGRVGLGGARTRNANRARRQPRSDTTRATKRTQAHSIGPSAPDARTSLRKHLCPLAPTLLQEAADPGGKKSPGSQVQRPRAPGEGEGPAGAEPPSPGLGPPCEPPPRPTCPAGRATFPSLDTPFTNISTRTPELHLLPHTRL